MHSPALSAASLNLASSKNDAASHKKKLIPGAP